MGGRSKRKNVPRNRSSNPKLGNSELIRSNNGNHSRTISSSIRYERQELFSGPLPHPDILAKFNGIIPDGAERIMQMAENQQKHRMGLENRVVDGNLKRSDTGQILGFIVAFTITIIGGFLIYFDKDTVGIIGLFGPIISLVSIFVIEKRSQKKELENRKLTETEKRA